MDIKEYPLQKKLSNELDLLGHCQTINGKISPRVIFITNVNVLSNKVRVDFYSPNKGQTIAALVKKNSYRDARFTRGDMIIVNESKVQPKMVKTANGWTKSSEKKDLWITNYTVVKGSD